MTKTFVTSNTMTDYESDTAIPGSIPRSVKDQSQTMTPELNTDFKFVWVTRYRTNMILSDEVSTIGDRSVDVFVADPSLSQQEQKEQVIDDLHDRYGTIEDLSVTLSHVTDLRSAEDASN